MKNLLNFLIEDKKIVTFMKYWILETKMTTIMNKKSQYFHLGDNQKNGWKFN